VPRLAPELADAHLGGLLAEFERSGAPVDVCFRDLVPGPTVRDRAAQDLHPYPARLLVNIPAFFLSTSLTKRGDLVADPFCGSGTVLLEAISAGRDAVGADANPLARLIARVKVTPVSRKRLAAAQRRFARLATGDIVGDYPDVVNLDYWFYPHVRRELLAILRCIERTRDPVVRDVLSVAFSACVKEVSLADPRLSVPVRLRKDQYPVGHWLHAKTVARLTKLKHVRVRELFCRRLADLSGRLAVSRDAAGAFHGIEADARNLASVGDSSVDLVLTSPPYLGAQKYIRASSLSLTWLSLCKATGLRALEDQNIGREHFGKRDYEASSVTGLSDADRLIALARLRDPLRAHIATTYLSEMRHAIEECARVLRVGGHLVLVIGAGTLTGMSFPTPQYLTALAEETGLHLRLHLVDQIRSRSLMTKRHSTAGSIDSESILLFRRGG
jgi:DNA modification methylase